MNKIDFKEGGFPFNTDTLTFMQKAYSDCTSALSALGGDNYILKGCTVTGGAVSDGFVVINGEVLPFKRGTLQATVMIRENKESVLYADDIERDSFFNRWVEFGTGAEQISWASLTRIDNLQKMASKLSELTGVLNNHSSSSTAHPRDTRNQIKGNYSLTSHTHSDINSWRGVDDVPVNGQKNESISSNWAYDHKSNSQAHPRDARNAIKDHSHSRDTRSAPKIHSHSDYLSTSGGDMLGGIKMSNQFVHNVCARTDFSKKETTATQLSSEYNIFYDTSNDSTRYVKLPTGKEGYVIWIGSKYNTDLYTTTGVRTKGASATTSKTRLTSNENTWCCFIYVDSEWTVVSYYDTH